MLKIIIAAFALLLPMLDGRHVTNASNFATFSIAEMVVLATDKCHDSATPEEDVVVVCFVTYSLFVVIVVVDAAAVRVLTFGDTIDILIKWSSLDGGLHFAASRSMFGAAVVTGQ